MAMIFDTDPVADYECGTRVCSEKDDVLQDDYRVASPASYFMPLAYPGYISQLRNCQQPLGL